MKKNNNKRIGALIGSLLPLFTMAQTVNTGTLYVSPNTILSSESDVDNQAGSTIVNNGVTYLYAGFNNDGSMNFTPGSTGQVRFEGQNPQPISGANPSYLYDVYFNNSTGFENSGIMQIAHESEFINGIFNNDNFGGELIFQDNAYHSSTSNNSFVDGTVVKLGNDAFEFPVGDVQYYRRCAISSPSNAGDSFSSKYFFQNPDSSYPLANKAPNVSIIDEKEYWEIKRENGNSIVTVTLSWDETTTPSSVLSPSSQLHIVRWDVAQQKWKDEGGIVDETNKTVTTITDMDTYGIFTLANVAIINISEGVSPNGDGLNDALIIENIESFPNTKISIFNRWGALVYESDNYLNDWKGISESPLNVGGNELPEGTYYYLVELGGDPNSQYYGKAYKGFFYLKRK